MSLSLFRFVGAFFFDREKVTEDHSINRMNIFEKKQDNFFFSEFFSININFVLFVIDL